MTVKIAIAGKGGTGKTTLAALIIRGLKKVEKTPILAVDADANANLNEALGLEIEGSLSDIINKISNNKDIPTGMTKEQYLRFRVHQSLTEGDDVDLLVMGGPEGPGCYCYANTLLRNFMDELSENYPYIVMDNEAGMEHLSRRTTENVEFLFIVSDSSARGIRSAKRMKELVESLNLDVKKIFLVITKTINNSLNLLEEEIENTGLNLIGSIPYDEKVAEYDLQGKPLIALPDDSFAVTAVEKILKNASLL